MLLALEAAVLVLSTCIPSPALASKTWTGSISSDWFDISNWAEGALPTTSEEVWLNTGQPNAVALKSGDTVSVYLLRVGYTSDASMSVTEGADFYVSNSLVLGSGSAVEGTIMVSGSGTTVTTDQQVFVGYLGSGYLTISDGATLVNASFANIASQVGSTGYAVVTGEGSSWISSNNIHVGNYGYGQLMVSAGADMRANWVALAQGDINSIGSVTVTGAGSTLISDTSFSIGSKGAATFSVLDGAYAACAASNTSFVARDAGSSAVVLVSGSGSLLAVDNFHIGQLGTATVSVLDGGAITGYWVTVGRSGTSQGNLIVSGQSSSLSVGNNLDVGVYSVGALTLSDQGTINSYFTNLGFYAGSTGSAVVSGAGTSWLATGEMRVGKAGVGSLTVSNGAYVYSSSAFSIGYETAGVGSVVLTGQGTHLETNGNLNVGQSGNGTLTVSNGAVATTTAALYIAKNAGTTGTLTIGAAYGTQAGAAGTIEASSVIFGLGTGKLVFNHTNSAYVFSSNLTGTGSIIASSGTTYLTGNLSAYTGTTTIESNATLYLNNSYNGSVIISSGILNANGTVSGLVTVNSGGTLKGSGTIGGATVNAGAIVAPGNSIGTLSVSGNVSFAAGSFYDVEINASGASDKIVATGTATITGGTVRLLPESGESYRAGTTYTILSAAGGVTGAFDSIILEDVSVFLTSSLSYDSNSIYATLQRNAVSFTSIAASDNQYQVAAVLDGMNVSSSFYNAVSSATSADQARITYQNLSGELHADIKSSFVQGASFYQDLILSEADLKTQARRFWVKAIGDTLSLDGVSPETSSFSLARKGIAFGAGADSPISIFDQVGIASGSTQTHTKLDRTQGNKAKGVIHDYFVSVYGTRDIGAIELKGAGLYTYSDVDTDRFVQIADYAQNHTASYQAQTLSGVVEFSYAMFHGPDALLSPYLRFSYGCGRIGEIDENGGEASLYADSDAFSYGNYVFGFRASQALRGIHNYPVYLNFNLGWQHAVGEIGYSGQYHFEGQPDMNAQAAPLARDTALFEIGLETRVRETADLMFGYAAHTAPNSHGHSLKAGLRWQF